MSRYGYYFEQDNYSDVSDFFVKAYCPHCERRIEVLREEADYNEKLQRWEADDLCSEYGDGIVDLRKDEWV